jgi:hypothetical protein
MRRIIQKKVYDTEDCVVILNKPSFTRGEYKGDCLIGKTKNGNYFYAWDKKSLDPEIRGSYIHALEREQVIQKIEESMSATLTDEDTEKIMSEFHEELQPA